MSNKLSGEISLCDTERGYIVIKDSKGNNLRLVSKDFVLDDISKLKEEISKLQSEVFRLEIKTVEYLYFAVVLILLFFGIVSLCNSFHDK